jgi:hypothetical protein
MNAHDKWLQSQYDQAAQDEAQVAAAIVSEADAIISECAADISKAIEFASDFEALLDDRGAIIWNACSAVETWRNQAGRPDAYSELYAHAAIGRRVYELVYQAALKRAKFQIES